MKRAWIALVALALLALPATAMAHHGPKPEVKNAAKYCKSLRTQMGVADFRDAYGGGNNAFGKCVSQRVHELRQARKAALRACIQELGVNKHSLRHEGGGGSKKAKRQALRRCVAQKSSHETAGAKQDFLAAVRTCLAEHDANPADFETNYGDDDSNVRETFGSCVHEKLQGDDQSEPGDDDGGTEPGDDGGDETEPSEEPDSPSDE